MKKLQLVGIAVVTVGSAFAGGITWTGGAGDFDISKPANWGVESLSGSDNATIGVNDQTFTLGDDVSFKSLSVTQKNATFDFSANPQKTISFAADGQFLPTVGSGALNFIGGIWDMKSGTFYATPQNSKTVATFDGAVVTNVGTFFWGEHSYDQVTTLKGGAVLHAATAENFATGARNILNVTDGSYFKCASFYTDYAGSPTETTGRNVVNVSGSGTVFKVTSLFRIGRDHYRNRLTVSDQATCSVTGVNMGKKEEAIEATNATITISGLAVGSTSNRVEIVDCTATLGGTITLGSTYGQTLIRDSAVTIGTMTLSSSYETAVISNCTGSIVPPSISGGTSNLVEVADCAATISGAIAISGGNHGRIMVRNCGKSSCTATISGGTDNEIAACIVGENKVAAMGTAIGSGNRIRLLTGSAVTNGLWSGESNKELTICGDGATGASFYSSAKLAFGASNKNGTKTNAWLRLNDGLQFQQTASFYFGINEASGSNTGCGTGHDNVLYFGTNVVANFVRIRAGNSGERIILDSGRLETGDLSLGYGYHPDYPASVTMIYRGTHPKLYFTAKSGYTMPGGNHLSQFDIPNEGYDSAPVQAKNTLTVGATSNIKVNVDPVAVSKAHGGESVLVPLATGSSLTISDEKLASLTAGLGTPGARFVKNDKTLYLRVASTKGIMVIVR